MSTTEGDDKPLKYPHIFQVADICVINKIDLAPYLNTKVEVLRENALKVNHHLQIFEVSATKETGWMHGVTGCRQRVQSVNKYPGF